MNSSVACPLCSRLEPKQVVNWACLQNGQYKNGCALKNNKLTYESVGSNSHQIIEDITTGLNTIEAQVSSWSWKKTLAILAMFSGGVGSGWWGHVYQTESSLSETGKSKIQYQLEIVKDCLNSKLVDCADHLVKAAMKIDKNNSIALDIKAHLDNIEHKILHTPSVQPIQSLSHNTDNSLINLASSNLNAGKNCLEKKQLPCAIEYANLIIQNINGDTQEKQNLLNEAAQLRRDALDEQTKNSIETNNHPTEPKYAPTEKSNKERPKKIKENASGHSKTKSKETNDENLKIPSVIIR